MTDPISRTSQFPASLTPHRAHLSPQTSPPLKGAPSGLSLAGGAAQADAERRALQAALEGCGRVTRAVEPKVAAKPRRMVGRGAGGRCDGAVRRLPQRRARQPLPIVDRAQSSLGRRCGAAARANERRGRLRGGAHPFLPYVATHFSHISHFNLVHSRLATASRRSAPRWSRGSATGCARTARCAGSSSAR